MRLAQQVSTAIVPVAPAVPAIPATTAQPEALGPYAEALVAAPELSLVTTGVVLGALWGGLTGWTLGSLTRSKQPLTWTAVSAAAGAALLGAKGYHKGKELEQWLQAHS